MYGKKNLFFSIFWILLGFGLNAGYFAGRLDDFWQSLGFAFIFVGALQLLRQRRYHTNEAFREKVDTASRDERNRFLANKAWAWTGYWCVMLLGLGTFVFKFLGREDLMMFTSGTMCLMLVLYWGNFLYLSKKY